MSLRCFMYSCLFVLFGFGLVGCSSGGPADPSPTDDAMTSPGIMGTDDPNSPDAAAAQQ